MTDITNQAIDTKRACALCGGELAADTQICRRCGSAASRVGRCSQCQSLSSIEPSKELQWKCSVCGSARLVPTNLENFPEVQLSLRQATRVSRLSNIVKPLAYGTSVVFFIGFVLAFIIKALVEPSDGAAGLLFAFPALMLLLSAFGFWKASNLRKQRDLQLKEAYKHAILQLITTFGAKSTPSDIAKTFGIDATRSERLLAELNSRDDISSEVTDDGQIVYSSVALPNQAVPMTQPFTERLRVPDEPSAGAQAQESTPGQIREPEVRTMLSSVETPGPKLRTP